MLENGQKDESNEYVRLLLPAIALTLEFLRGSSLAQDADATNQLQSVHTAKTQKVERGRTGGTRHKSAQRIEEPAARLNR